MAIGIFDSGIGGLTAVKELEKIYPDADFVYFGDTARIPYGTRGIDVINKYSLQDCRFLISHNVEAILVACCTVSSNSLPLLKSAFDVPIFGVVEPAVKKAVAVANSGNGIVAVLGTGATVKSNSFANAIHAIDPKLTVISKSCPLFVPLVENGHTSPNDPISIAAANEYLKDILPKNPSAVILGCTHYPLLIPVISQFLKDSILINCAFEAVSDVLGISSFAKNGSNKKFFVSDNTEDFCRIACSFIGRDITGNVKETDIESY
ncbi:MAG: glutamate racemase [Clostridia bacterium]